METTVVKSTATQYLMALHNLKESLPPFSEARKVINEHIMDVNDFIDKDLPK